MNIHGEFSSRFHSDSKRSRSGFQSKRRESPRIHNVFAQQYGFANFGRVFTVIRCETLSWVNICNWFRRPSNTHNACTFDTVMVYTGVFLRGNIPNHDRHTLAKEKTRTSHFQILVICLQFSLSGNTSIII